MVFGRERFYFIFIGEFGGWVRSIVLIFVLDE